MASPHSAPRPRGGGARARQPRRRGPAPRTGRRASASTTRTRDGRAQRSGCERSRSQAAACQLPRAAAAEKTRTRPGSAARRRSSRVGASPSSGLSLHARERVRWTAPDDAALGDPAADGLRRDVRTLGGDDDRHAVRKRLLDPLAERLRQDRGASHGLTRPVVSRGAHIAYSAARRGFQGSVDTRARSKNRQPPMPTSQRLASSNLEILRSPAPRRGSETLGAAAQQIFWTSSPFCPFVRPLARGLVLPTTVPAGV